MGAAENFWCGEPPSPSRLRRATSPKVGGDSALPMGELSPQATERASHIKSGKQRLQSKRLLPLRESFRPPFSKGGTDPTPWGVGRPSQRAKLSAAFFFLLSFFFCAYGVKEKWLRTLAPRPATHQNRKVLVELFQKLVGWRGNALLVLRRARNALRRLF